MTLFFLSDDNTDAYGYNPHTAAEKNRFKKSCHQKPQAKAHECDTQKPISSAHKNTPCTLYAQRVKNILRLQKFLIY